MKMRLLSVGFLVVVTLTSLIRGSTPGPSSLPRNVTVSEFLDTLLNREKYDPRVRPGADTDEPTVVKLQMKVYSVSSIDQVNMDFTLNIFLRQEWVDPRLAHDMFESDVSLNYNIQSRLWVPDTFLANEKEASRHDVTVPNLLLRLSPDGTVLYSQRLSVRLACKMSLLKFPMDHQTCLVKLESYGYTTRELILQWTNGTRPISYTTAELPEFKLTNISTGDCTVTYHTGTFTCIYGQLDLERQISYYVIQTYVPSFLVVILSWVSFWIDKDSPPARISLGLLTVLTITTQSSGINSRLPRVSYIKAIDVWMSTCLVFVFGAFLEYTIVNTLTRTTRKGSKEAAQNGQEPSKGAYVSIKNGNEEMKLRHRHGNRSTPSDPIIRPVHSTTCLSARKDPALFVDKVSRLMFPAAFLLFNLVYWITYMVIL